MAISQPPPPQDDPSVSDPLECPPLRWGLIGCGRVSHDFAQALKHITTASIAACAARDGARAEEFAKKHKVDKAYSSYDDLIQDPNVQAVYVGNIHIFRREIGEKCILAGKHCLLEKPFALNEADGKYLIDLAREKNVFIMEGMWTRFFPAVQQARRLVFGDDQQKPVLGQVASVFSDFNFDASDSEEYPTSFLYTHKLGGGATYLVGPYPVAAATLFFPGATPDAIKCVGQLDTNTGVDLQAAAILSYPPTSDVSPAMDASNTEENTPKLPGAAVASLTFGFLGETSEETVMVGTKGRLTIKTPGHCPTKLHVVLKGSGRGASAGETLYEYPLPEDTPIITENGGYFYPNSAGFCYEAAAAARCIAAGKLEPPQYTHQETLLTLKILDAVHEQLGVKPIGQA